MKARAYCRFLAALAALAPLAARAYTVNTTTSGAEIRWSASSASFLVNASGGPTGASTAMQSAMSTWSTVSGASFQFAYGGSTTLSGAVFDYNNVGSFGYLGTDGTVARNTTTYYVSSGQLLDSDIVFNTYYSWSVSGEAGKFDVQNIATHELGHSLSLADLYGGGDAEKTMYGYASLGETKKRSLDADDIAGIVYLYPFTPTVTLSVSGNPMAEAGGVATVTATLSGVAGRTVTVNLAFSGTASYGNDYTRSGTIITIPAGSTSGSMTLTALQDALNEANETIVVDISSVVNGTESGTQQVTARITDDDPLPTVTLGLSGSPVAEAGGVATVTATLSAVSGRAVYVYLSFAGTATVTSDYTRSGTSVTIPAGSLSGSIILTAVQDTLYEGNETIVVDISSVTYGTENGTQQVTATITDDDAPPTVVLGLSGSPMAEAGGVATVTATLSAVSGLPVTVNLAFSGTATLTSDYTRSATSITIPAGSVSGSIALTAVQDTLDEANETVIVDIGAVANGTENGTQQVTATITDDDAPPTVVLGLSGSPMAEAGGVATVTATLSAVSGLPVTVNLAFSGTATLTSDYTRSATNITIPAGSLSGSVMLTAVQDMANEVNETIVVDIDSVSNGTEDGTQQVTATITDDNPQSLVASPTSITVTEGSNATFTVRLAAQPAANVVASVGEASGDPDLTVSGTTIFTFTTNNWSTPQTVTIAAAEDADTANGTATFMVSSSGLTPVNVIATEADNDQPPTVTTPPQSQSVSVGGTATFTVTATGTLPLSYQWCFNGTNLAGQTTTALSLSNVQAAQAGSYTVVVTNVAGSVTSQVAVLTVLEPPAIVSQPQSRTNVVGSTAAFSVVASGTEPLAYQWCFNGTNLADQTTTALSLSNVQAAQAGSYTVVVTNATGSVTSAAAVLTVLEPPAIVSQPQSRTNVVGSTATFSVVASGTEPLAYQWCFNGTNLAGQTTTALSLSSVQAAQAGSYTVVVTNAAGSVTSAAAVLTVLEPPAIVSQPQSRTNVVGSTATFSVVASGTEPLAYQWCFNGTNLAGQTTAALSLSNVQAAQAGSYTVVVTNAAGSVTSQVATLTVLVPPAIVSQPQSRTNVVGSTATFSVVASGTEPLAYQWCFNGTNLVTGGRIGGATSSTLAISSVETNDAGTYSVLVSNVCSTVASAEAVLTVSASPGMEGSVYVTTYVGSVLTTCAPVCYDPLGLGCTVSTYGSTAISGAPGVPSRTKCTYGWAGTVNWSVLPILDPANAGGVYRIEVAHTATSSTTKDATVTAWSDYGTVSASCTNSPVFQQSYGGDVWQTMGYITNQPGTSDPLIYFIVTGGTVNNSGNRLYIDAFKFTHVDSCDGVVGDLIVTGPLAAGNMYVPVTGVTAGATNVTVYANDVEIGQTNYAAGFAAGALDVPVNSALVQGNIIKATQSKTNAIGGVCTSAMPTDGPPVLEPPAIVSQPQSRTNVVGSTATFSVEASGTEPLAYQWCFNGTNLAGQTTAALSLSNVQTAQAGSYTVVVTNAAGSVTSAAAVLTVLEPPAIVSQPQSRTNVVGSTAVFSVVASGTEPLAYQWCFNGTNLADQTTTALSLSNVQASQAGPYTVVVTNAAGAVTSAVATLTVLVPPTIVSQPQSRTNVVGSTATFSVAASGTEPLAYQWCFNGTNLAGQTSTTLTLGSVQTAQAGSYTVVVTNAAGSVTSQVAALTVLVPTRIISLSGDLAFGDVLVGSSSNRVLTITNAGNSALRVTNITYSPPGVFGGDWAGSIPAGGSTNVTVTFSPTAATSYSGTVRVNSDATGGVDTMSSSGSGVPCDLVVVNTSDSGAGSLRQAILNANICGGGIVVFSNVSGAITLTSGELVISRNVNIIGPGATNLAVSGNNAVRVFNISSNAICGVSGLTIANGAATWPSHGGAIYNAGFLTLSDCTISDSHTSSGFGGGIYNAGVLVLNGSTLTGNRASGGDGGRGAGGGGGGAGLGGAIYSMGPNVAMTNCTFSRNEAVGGNGGWTSGGNNTFGGYGGGPTGGNGGGLCEPGQNGGYGSGGGGGGGWWETPYETICLGKSGGNGGFGGGGGGAGDYIGGAVGGTGGDFGGDANNQDGGGGAGLGGGFFVESGDVTIVNCTFTQNGVTAGAGAQSLGGAIFRMGGIVRLLNSLITGQAGGWGTCDVVGGVYSLGHNLVSDAFCFDEGDCDLVFVDASAYLGELQYSGGATPTHPLLCNSPAIDAGTTTGAPGFDQRGVPRPQGTAVDIGAFEFVHLPPTIAASPQDQTVSVGDTATFTVTASGTPPLFYQWRFNGTDLAGQTTTALSLSNVQTTQAGSYTVVVTNAAGSVTSAAGVLTVVLPPAPVSGSVVAWGGNAKGQSSVPPGLTDVVAVAGGIDHSLALKTDGTVVGWGLNSYGQTNPPAGLSNVVAVAAGWDTSFALKRDGTLEEWGWDGDYGLKATAEALTNIIAVSALWDCGMVLKSDNTVFVWGKSRYGETNVPAGLADVVAISGGGQFCMAKKRDGTVVVWGGNYTGQTNVPAGLNSVAAVAAGSYHCLALRSNGTVVAWGDNAYGQTNVPPDLTNAVAVSAGGSHSLALRADGTLAVWGRGDLGQTNIPPCLHSVFAISSGGGHNLALVPGFYPMRFSGVDYLPNGQARLTVDGLAGDVYRVLGSSNLLDWLAIGTVTNASGTVTFTDASAPNFNRRFYRLVTP